LAVADFKEATAAGDEAPCTTPITFDTEFAKALAMAAFAEGIRVRFAQYYG
jgi:hypothetical protein